MSLTDQQVESYREDGHVTVPNVFSQAQVKTASDELNNWIADFSKNLAPQDERYYFEQSEPNARTLRKLDNPVFHRPLFRDMAHDKKLLTLTRDLIGSKLRVVFSQVFLKPSEVGGPKPVHQDNFYFGPENLDNIVTVWIAIDSATKENGCLFFANGSNRGPVHDHTAPPGEPFNLQVPPEIARQYEMTAEPVPSGGVSFHHGNVIHQSSPNLSDGPRRAIAMHYLSQDNRFANPALDYDESIIVEIRE